MAQFLKLFIHAIEKHNGEAIGDCISVARQWINETVTEAGALKVGSIALLLGADPWKDSRQMMQAVSLKWDKKL